MFTTPETQLYKAQYDALFEDTANNPYLTHSSRESRNKALKTSDKRIIKAINEVKSSVDVVDASNTSFMAMTNSIIGDHAGNAVLHQAFVNTGYQNLTDAIINIDARTKDDNKEMVFWLPKLRSSSIVHPELAVPFNCDITNVMARFSLADNDVTSITDDVEIELQHTSNADTDPFVTFKTITITAGNSSVEEAINPSYHFTAGIIKARLVRFPNDLKNLNIIVTFKKSLV